jgi:hypothetical protein
MKRFRRWLFNGLVALSLLLAVVTATLWITGYSSANTGEWLHFRSHGTPTKWDFHARPVRGELYFMWTLRDDGNWMDTRYYNASRNFLGFGENHQPRSAAPPPDRAMHLGVVILPLWLPLFISAAIPLIWLGQWKRRKTVRAGLCALCGYDLRATPDRCPECGKIVEEVI